MGMESFMMIDPTIQVEDRKSGFLITDRVENFFFDTTLQGLTFSSENAAVVSQLLQISF